MKIKRILTALVCMPLLLLLVHLGLVPVLVLITVGSLAALFEFFRIMDGCGYRYMKTPAIISCVLLMACFYLQAIGTPLIVAAVTLILPALMLAGILSGNSNMFQAVSITFTGIFYTAWLPGHLLLLRGIQHYGESLVYFLLVITWFSDIFAYWIGSAIGKHKMAEAISPKKTWEGAIAGLVFPVAAALLYKSFSMAGIMAGWGLSLDFISPFHCVVIGVVLGITGQAGDLSESMLKRKAGIKDSGTLLPGHGGILDRCDSLIFNVPVLYYLIKLIIR